MLDAAPSACVLRLIRSVALTKRRRLFSEDLKPIFQRFIKSLRFSARKHFYPTIRRMRALTFPTARHFFLHRLMDVLCLLNSEQTNALVVHQRSINREFRFRYLFSARETNVLDPQLSPPHDAASATTTFCSM